MFADSPATAAAPRPVSPEAEARAFWRLRFRLIWTMLRQTVATARLRLGLVIVLSGLLWYGLYWLLREAFVFLQTAIPQPSHDQIVHGIFGSFFLFLMGMLILSSSIILYVSLFRAPEVALLLTLPARDERVFIHKFQEAVLLSSWGFLLLGSPMFVAYGVVTGAPWYFYAMLLPFMVAFVYIPVAVGGIFCLEVVYRLPRLRLQLIVLAGIAVVAAAAWLFWSTFARPESDLLTADWFRKMMGSLGMSQAQLLPSWWLSSGLLQAGRGEWSDSLMLMVVLVANALFLRQVAVWLAIRLYRAAYSGLYNLGGRRKPARANWLDRTAGRLTAFLPRPVQLLIIKDLRLFRRDPAQWAQFVVFLCLLLLYFVNVRRLSYNGIYSGWVSLVSFLNVTVVGLLMSTFTTRFIFPMLSQGRRFWLLGLLPLRRETILWSKFAFAIAGSLLPCSALVLVSDLLLAVPAALVGNHQLACLLLCLGLVGIAVGLGARLPNLREQSPARIAAGFGGTLNLVVSTLYILLIVVMMTVPYHFYLAADFTRSTFGYHEAAAIGRWLLTWLRWGTFGSLLLAAAATSLPLWVGLRAFRRMEF